MSQFANTMSQHMDLRKQKFETTCTYIYCLFLISSTLMSFWSTPCDTFEWFVYLHTNQHTGQTYSIGTCVLIWTNQYYAVSEIKLLCCEIGVPSLSICWVKTYGSQQNWTMQSHIYGKSQMSQAVYCSSINRLKEPNARTMKDWWIGAKTICSNVNFQLISKWDA